LTLWLLLCALLRILTGIITFTVGVNFVIRFV
jgi:hypothetical protein